ncbi:cytochrome P450 [Whalleya microplaca]|nr:cytochrome P450 [Whalleya microplaca]
MDRPFMNIEAWLTWMGECMRVPWPSPSTELGITDILLKNGAGLLIFAVLLNHILVTIRYYWAHCNEVDGQIPPTYPSAIPLFGNLISFVWNNAEFCRRVTSYRGRFTSVRLSFFGMRIYLFQDRETIKRIWKAPSLSSPMSIQIYTHRYFFGTPERTLATYIADNSGPHEKPYPGSNVPPKNRIDHITHRGYLRALTGPGLSPTIRRFMDGLQTRVGQLAFAGEWQDLEDFRSFFQNLMGGALLESLFGPELIRLNPNIVGDLLEFDANIPWLARGIPSFIKPAPYRLRSRLWSQFKRWKNYARKEFHESRISEDGDGDPFWGSGMNRWRHEILPQVGYHDDNALAAADLGLAFGLLTNINPSTMLGVWHIFRDPDLLKRIRNELQENFGQQSIQGIDPKQLTRLPLLSSVYAETLRLYINTFIMVNSPQKDVLLGKWRLPKEHFGLLNSYLSHRDAEFWNTKDGLYPVDAFWADRFLTDPSDPTSGPVNPALNEAQRRAENAKDEKPFFSMDGLETSWFPYGGGYSICPGRYLAKTAMLFTCALLASEFDVDCLTDRIELDNWRFGLGAQVPKNPLPFRIKRRTQA